MIVSKTWRVSKARNRVTRITTMGLMMKRIALLTLGFLMVCNCAFATIPNDYIGAIDNGEKSFAGSHTSSFIDYFSFDIESLSDVEALTASFELPALNYGITNLSFSLFKDDDYTIKIDPSLSGPSSNPLVYLFDEMTIGTYFFTVSGDVASGMKGVYAGSISASQVPVPAAALLLGAGLLGIVGVRRRQNL